MTETLTISSRDMMLSAWVGTSKSNFRLADSSTVFDMMTYASVRLTSVSFLYLATTVLLVAQDKTPLNGEANDSDGHLTWISEAARQSGRWKISSWVYNQAQSGKVRTIWQPLNGVTWVRAPANTENRRGSLVDVGTVEPQVQNGSILYGANGNRLAPYYVAAEAAGKQGHEDHNAICQVRLTVLLRESLQDIFMQMVSEVTQKNAERFDVKYTITLEQKELGESIRIEWTPAMSPDLVSLLLGRYKEGLMRFEPTGTSEYVVSSNREPVLKNGRVRVLDPEGTELGAAYAPAYAAPCEN